MLKLTRKEQASGMDELVQALMPILEKSMGVCCKEQLVTSTQQASAVFIATNSEEKVLLEQPTYARMNELVKTLVHDDWGVRMDGGDLNRLKVIREWRVFPISIRFPIS